MHINSIDLIQDCVKHLKYISIYCWTLLRGNFQLCNAFSDLNWISTNYVLNDASTVHIRAAQKFSKHLCNICNLTYGCRELQYTMIRNWKSNWMDSSRRFLFLGSNKYWNTRVKWQRNFSASSLSQFISDWFTWLCIKTNWLLYCDIWFSIKFIGFNIYNL